MTTYAIIAHTQVLENYGDVERPHWKCKGGDAYWIANIITDRDAAGLEHAGINLPNIGAIECRNSCHLIEFVKSIEVVSVEEALRRESIDLNDFNLTADEYFSHVTRAEDWDCYMLGGQ